MGMVEPRADDLCVTLALAWLWSRLAHIERCLRLSRVVAEDRPSWLSLSFASCSRRARHGRWMPCGGWMDVDRPIVLFVPLPQHFYSSSCCAYPAPPSMFVFSQVVTMTRHVHTEAYFPPVAPPPRPYAILGCSRRQQQQQQPTPQHGDRRSSGEQVGRGDDEGLVFHFRLRWGPPGGGRGAGRNEGRGPGQGEGAPQVHTYIGIGMYVHARNMLTKTHLSPLYDDDSAWPLFADEERLQSWLVTFVFKPAGGSERRLFCDRLFEAKRLLSRNEGRRTDVTRGSISLATNPAPIPTPTPPGHNQNRKLSTSCKSPCCSPPA